MLQHPEGLESSGFRCFRVQERQHDMTDAAHAGAPKRSGSSSRAERTAQASRVNKMGQALKLKSFNYPLNTTITRPTTTLLFVCL